VRLAPLVVMATLGCGTGDGNAPVVEDSTAGASPVAEVLPTSVAELAPGDTLGLLDLMRRHIAAGDREAALAERRDTTMPNEGYREARRLTLFVRGGEPVKLVATEPNDAGLMTGETVTWFDRGEVRVVQEPFTVLYFEVDGLVLWTDEAMVPVDAPEADFSIRERAVIDSVKARLRVFGLGYP
jgi:hypothetical protein